MSKITINPPQFDPGDSEDVRIYKQRQFVEDVIRMTQELNEELESAASGGGGAGSGGYPAQLGYAGIR